VQEIVVLLFVVAVLLIAGTVAIVQLLVRVYRVLHGESVGRIDAPRSYVQPYQNWPTDEAERSTTRSLETEPTLVLRRKAAARTACEKCDSFDTIRATEFGQPCIFCELEARAASGEQ
jgi:hypothetical protein